MTKPDLLTDPDLDLRELYKDQLLSPKDHGKLGAHVGGGNPLVPLLRDYILQGAAYNVPRAVHRSLRGFDYGMCGNDRYGCCVFAEMAHAIQHSRKTVGRSDAPAGDDALMRCTLQAYSEQTGFNASDPSTDQGADPVAAHGYWQDPGFPLPDGTRDKIAGCVQILPHDGVNIRRGIYEFDVAALALAMPLAWQQADIWDVGGDFNSDPDWQPGGWGGHQTALVSFDAKRLALLTWGGVKLISWPAVGTYGQVVICRVSADQIGAGGLSETGVDISALGRDLPQL